MIDLKSSRSWIIKILIILPISCRIPTNIVSKPSPPPPVASRSKTGFPSKTSSNRPKPSLCAAPLLGRKMVQSAGISGTGSHHAQKSSSNHQGKFILNMSGESESCSSAMSSLESVRSSEVSLLQAVNSQKLSPFLDDEHIFGSVSFSFIHTLGLFYFFRSNLYLYSYI